MIAFGALANALALGPTPAPEQPRAPKAEPGAPAEVADSPPPQPTQPEAASGEMSAWPINRYDKLIRKSPFAPPSVAPVVAAVPGFAANLYLSGLAKIGDRDFVSISSRDQAVKWSLFAGESNVDGIQLVSVQWADAVGKSKVTVKKGTEFAVLEYDQALLQKPVTMTPQPINIAQPPRPNIPGQPGQPMHPVSLPHPGFSGQPNPAVQIIQPNQANPIPGGNPGTVLGQPNNGQPVIPIRRRTIIRTEP